MKLIWIIVIGVVVLIIALVAFFLYYRSKNRKKHPFFVWSRQSGRLITVLYPDMKANPQNPADVRFVFKNDRSKLEPRPPMREDEEGRGVWDVARGDDGRLLYLEDDDGVDFDG